jgi:hypothetical protein
LKGLSKLLPLSAIGFAIFMSFCTSPKNSEDIFPDFSAISVEGEHLNSRWLKKNVFVIFVTSREPYHIDLLAAVYKNYQKSGLHIIAFARESSISKKLAVMFPGIWVIVDHEEKYLRLFNGRSCCGRHYFYGSDLRLLATANNTVSYEEGIKVYLQQVINHKKFDFSLLLPEANIADSPLFYEIWEQLKRQNKENYFIFMISDVCIACPIAKKISDLSAATMRTRSSLGGMIIFSSDFSDIDIQNFEVQWKAGIQLSRATGELANHWNLLINDFRRNDVNGILLLMDSNGTLIAANEEAFKKLGI